MHRTRKLAAAAVLSGAVVLQALPASAAVDGWHNGSTVWVGPYPTRADLYTVAGYADTWRIQYQWASAYHAEWGNLRLWTDGTLRTSWTGWVYYGPSQNYINWHYWKYAHSATLCVRFPYHGNAQTCASATR